MLVDLEPMGRERDLELLAAQVAAQGFERAARGLERVVGVVALVQREQHLAAHQVGLEQERR